MACGEDRRLRDHGQQREQVNNMGDRMAQNTKHKKSKKVKRQNVSLVFETKEYSEKSAKSAILYGVSKLKVFGLARNHRPQPIVLTRATNSSARSSPKVIYAHWRMDKIAGWRTKSERTHWASTSTMGNSKPLVAAIPLLAMRMR